VRVRSGSIKARGWKALMHPPGYHTPNGRPDSAFFSAVAAKRVESARFPLWGLKFTQVSFTIND
jgi:hypothetical protein